MANFIISLGTINKKMLYPLIYIIIHFAINIYDLYLEYNEVSLFIDGFGYSLGEILTFFVAQIYKYKRVAVKKKKTPLKQYIKDYFFLFLINLCYQIIILSPFYLIKNSNKNEEEEAAKYKQLFINDAIEAIFVTTIAYFLLKYKFYIHHVISIIALVILAVIIDLLLGNYFGVSIPLVIITIFYILTDSIYYSYCKHLIEKKYYYFMDILFIIGIYDFILYTVSFTIILLTQKINGTYKLIFQFYDFYNNYGTWNMTSSFLVSLILHGVVLFILEMKILEMLGPNFVYLSYLIGKIPSAIISIEDYKRWIVLILSLFQILFILFYLEILEYNFCSLNKNTKKSIAEREHRQSISEINVEDDDDEIDIKGYDIKDSMKTQEKIKELNEMKEVFEEKENDD